MTTQPIANLAAALVKAQATAQAVAKTSTNSFQRYKYASAEALIEEARGALSEAGLALMTVKWQVLPLLVVPPEGTPQAASSRVLVNYLLVHTSGESMALEAETSIIPDKGRPQDKAEATALTYNLGYFLRGLLLLPREDESLAVDRRDDRDERRGPQRTEPTHPVAPRAPQEAPTDTLAGLVSAKDFLRAIVEADTVATLSAIANRASKVDLPTAEREAVRNAWMARKATIQARAA